MKVNLEKYRRAAFDEWSISTVLCELLNGQRGFTVALMGGVPATVLAVNVDSRFPAARLYEFCDQAAARYGLPQRIWTDCGPEGMSPHLKQWGLANSVAISHRAGHSLTRSKACLQFEQWLGKTSQRIGAYESVEKCKRAIEQSLSGHNSLLVRSARRCHADPALFPRAPRTPDDSRTERYLRCLAPDERTEVDSTLIDVAHVMRQAAQPERQPAMTSLGSDQHTLDEDAGRGNKEV